jgi:hypothetical protein
VNILHFLLILALLTGPSSAFSEAEDIFSSLPEGDTSPISFQEADVFGPAICERPADFFDTWGNCTYHGAISPLLKFDHYLTQQFLYVLYGSFTKIGAQEVLLGLARAETDVIVLSGVLLQRAGTEWQAAWFLPEALDHAYLMFPGKDGRSVLVGRRDDREFMLPEEGVEINVLRIDDHQVVTESLFRYVNQHPACPFPPAPGARRVEIVHWSRQDMSGDGGVDLVIELLETELPELVCNGDVQSPHETEAVTKMVHQLVFLFDGERFEATPETAQIIRRLARFSQ